MNYNNFKRHYYNIQWEAYKHDDGTYERIYVTVFRDGDLLNGERSS